MCSVKCANPGTAAGSEKWPARTSRAAAALAASLSWINRASSPLDSLTHLYVRGSRGGALISSRCSKTVAVVVGAAPPACCRSVAEAVTVLQRARGRFRKEAAWPGGESTEAVRSVVSAIWRQEMRIAPCAHRTKATRKRGWWSPLPAPPVRTVDGRPSTSRVSRARAFGGVVGDLGSLARSHLKLFPELSITNLPKKRCNGLYFFYVHTAPHRYAHGRWDVQRDAEPSPPLFSSWHSAPGCELV